MATQHGRSGDIFRLRAGPHAQPCGWHGSTDVDRVPYRLRLALGYGDNGDNERATPSATAASRSASA